MIKNSEIFIFNNNFFYKNWNEYNESELIKFILPLENIEIIQNINNFKKDLIDINLSSLFQEYTDKNLALILIEDIGKSINKVYMKTNIQGKNYFKEFEFKKDKNLDITNAKSN